MVATQHNAWIHATATLVVVAVGLLVGLSWSEWCWIVFAISSVWTAEALNTAIEELCDHVTPEEHPRIGKVKDLGSGASLLIGITSLIVGYMVFVPRLAALL